MRGCVRSNCLVAMQINSGWSHAESSIGLADITPLWADIRRGLKWGFSSPESMTCLTAHAAEKIACERLWETCTTVTSSVWPRPTVKGLYERKIYSKRHIYLASNVFAL